MNKETLDLQMEACFKKQVIWSKSPRNHERARKFQTIHPFIHPGCQSVAVQVPNNSNEKKINIYNK